MKATRKTILIVLAFFAIYVIWGSTYLLNKIAVTELSPFYLVSIRFSVSSLLIFIIAICLKIPLKITTKQFINNLIAGFLFLVYGNGIFVWALRFVDSGIGALEASIQPLMVLVLMRIIDGKKIQKKSIIGITLGVIGMYLLVSQKLLIYNNQSLIGIIMIFTCILSWSWASLFVARVELAPNYFVNAGYQMLIAGVLLLIISAALGETWLPPLQWQQKTQLSMVLLIVFGSIIAFTAFNFLLCEVSTEKVSTSAYVNPVIALFLGWYVLNEAISVQSILAAVVLLTGVYFINTKRIFKPRINGR